MSLRKAASSFDYIVEAVHLLADEGWELLPLYRFDPESGAWEHESGLRGSPLGLHDVSFGSGTLELRGSRPTAPESVLPSYLEEARRIVREGEAGAESIELQAPKVPPTFKRIRWFPLPGEALADLRAAARAEPAR